MPRKRTFDSQQKSNIVSLGVSERGTEWAGEEDSVHNLKVDGADVEVGYVNPTRARREHISPIYVIWGGAYDFEGNARDFKKRYPDLARFLA